MTGLARRSESRFLASTLGASTRQIEPPTVAAAVPMFLASLSVRSPRTRLTYRTGLARFVEYLQVVELDPDAVLTTELPATICEDFNAALAEVFPVKATAANYTSSVKSFFRWVYRRRWGPSGCTFEEMALGIRESTARFTYRSRRPDPKLAEVVKGVLSATAPEWPSGRRSDAAGALALLRDKALFTLMLTSGLRAAEVCSLNRADLENDPVCVRGKGDKERPFFLSEPAQQAIAAYLVARTDDSPALFLSHHRSGGHGQARRGAARPDSRLSEQGLWSLTRKYGAAGGAHLTPHMFRHQHARDLRKAGVSMADISELLGHSSVHVTHTVYARIDTAGLRSAYKRYEDQLPSVLPAD